MWIFTILGFFSIVAHRDKPGHMLVRARVRADLAALVRLFPLPRPKVQRTPDADYLFRAVVGKQAMARVLATLTEGIDYGNFKDAVARRQGVPRAKVYQNVWAALLPLQQPKLALVKPKPRRASGHVVFEYDASMIAEVQAQYAERLKALQKADEAEEKRASEQRIAAMHPDFVGRNTSDGSDISVETDAAMMPKKKSRSTKEDPDAGMMPDPISEDERFAELKANMDPLVFERMVDQARGEGIVTGNNLDEFETFEEWVARMEADPSEDPPLKPQRPRAPGKKI